MDFRSIFVRVSKVNLDNSRAVLATRGRPWRHAACQTDTENGDTGICFCCCGCCSGCCGCCCWLCFVLIVMFRPAFCHVDINVYRYSTCAFLIVKWMLMLIIYSAASSSVLYWA